VNLRNFLPAAGRLSPSEAADFGRGLTAGAGYVGVGPVVVLFNLPERFRKLDPPPLSIAELNSALGKWLEDFSEIFPPR
jgi:hypothetical protein